jgi:uncharacterized membrane protein YcjF (UPF0283 family)
MVYENNFRPVAGRPDPVSGGAENRKTDCPPESQPESRECPPPAGGEIVGGRPGDNMVDRPKGIPCPELLKSASVGPVGRPPQKEEGLRLEDLLTRLEHRPAGPRLTSFMGMVLIFVSAMVLFFFCSHAIALFNQIMQLSVPLRALSLAVMTILLGIIVWVVGRGIIFLVGLAGGAQLDCEQLGSLGENRGLKACRLARQEFLEPYLRRLQALEGKKRERFLLLVGDRPILEAAGKLLDGTRRIGSREWLSEFQETIQQPLEELAGSCTTGYANAAALKTALSPWPLVDMLAVAYNGVLMLTDLSLLFNRRLNRIGVLRIFLELSFSLLVAGRTQEAVTAVESYTGGLNGGASSLIDTVFGHFGPAVLSVAHFSAPRFAEGAATWLLMKRLGFSAVELLKPVSGAD